MSKVDDELTRRLHAAERPVDTDRLFDGLERRRSHRERLRRVQAGVVAFAVLAGTGVGFVALRAAFREDGRTAGDPNDLPANGQIVFAKDGEDLQLHIYTSQPDGTEVRQLTEGDGHDTHPAVSPDGRTVAFSHELPDGTAEAIATIPIDGGSITWRSDRYPGTGDPAWSPDGTRIAFVGYGVERAGLYVADVGTDRVRQIPLPGGDDASQAHPSWSPDGSQIAIALDSDILIVGPDGSDPRWIVETIDTAEFAPAWSPDGTTIAFLRSSVPEGILTDEVGPNEIRTIASDGGSATLIATAVDADLGLDLDWAPDGTALLVSDHDWIYRVDPTPDGDPRDNFVQMMEGFAPSWQPLPAGSPPSPTPSPEPSPSPEPAGHEIGLGFRLCHLHPFGGIDFLGDGNNGKAWTGTKVLEDGTCPDAYDDRYGVAVDYTGDGDADAFSETIEYCYFCRPFAAVDLDADGDDELAVMTSEGSTPAFMIYGADSTGGDPQVAPLLVADPGNLAARHEPDRPLTFSTGGDEGYSGWVRCDGFPAAPVLVITWRDHPIDGDTMEVHETRFALEEDGMFHIVGSNDYSAPVGEAIPGVSDEPACGVDWQIWG